MSDAAVTRHTDDEHAICLAQTEYRDAINAADPERALAVIAEYLAWMRDSEPSFWGREGRRALHAWIKRIAKAGMQLTIVPDNTLIYGANATARGWEILRPKDTDPARPEEQRFRYFQTWEKSQDGQWRMTSFICNKDVPPAMLEEEL